LIDKKKEYLLRKPGEASLRKNTWVVEPGEAYTRILG